jgi:hypothetical protein
MAMQLGIKSNALETPPQKPLKIMAVCLESIRAETTLKY